MAVKAAIAIDPAPIGGIFPDPLSLGAALPIVARINGWNTPFTISPAAFASHFANTLPPA